MIDREELTDGIAERLKNLRLSWRDEAGENVKLTHEELAKRISAEYGVSIHPDTLKFYELSKSSTKRYNNLGMKLETLVILADFYGVSADYILKTDYLPLSEAAKRNVTKLCNTPYRDLLNSILASTAFSDILSSLFVTKKQIEAKTEAVLNTQEPTENDLLMSEREARHLVRDSLEDMQKALERFCGFVSLKVLIISEKFPKNLTILLVLRTG